MEIEEKSFLFHIEEYKSIREEIIAYQSRRHDINRFGFAGYLAIYAWYFSESQGESEIIFLLLPLFLSISCLIMQRATSNGILVGGYYLSKIESKYADNEILGWERVRDIIRNMEKANKYEPPSKLYEELNIHKRINFGIRNITEVFWSCLCLTSFIFVCWVRYRGV